LMVDKITQQSHYRQILSNILSVQIVKGQK